MKIIKNKLFPIGKFGAMNILGLLFVKENVKLSTTTIRHEAIHTAQQYEIFGFCAAVALVVSCLWSQWWFLLLSIAMPILLYVFAWLIELALPPYSSAYKDSPFEREAYQNQSVPDYLATRPLFAWVKYILKDREWRK